MRPILTVLHLTLTEARRRRIVTAALLCATAFLIVYASAVFFARRGMDAVARMPFVQRQALLMALTLAGMYATNFLSVLFAVLLPVDALSGEIDSGVMQTIACKPLRRSEILIGKWLGFGLLALMYLVVL